MIRSENTHDWSVATSTDIDVALDDNLGFASTRWNAPVSRNTSNTFPRCTPHNKAATPAATAKTPPNGAATAPTPLPDPVALALAAALAELATELAAALALLAIEL